MIVVFSMDSLNFLPSLDNLGGILGNDPGRATARIIESSLLTPLKEFSNRPSKKFRQRLVFLASQLAIPDSEQINSAQDGKREIEIQCEFGAQIVEAIHSASLIIDDIEDGSLTRREQPTLHVQYGLPQALNAGNWLYFWPLKQIGALKLEKEKELALLKDTIDTMVNAHFGQSIDIGTRVDEIPQGSVEEVCLSSVSLKTGALMSLAMRMGGYIGGASFERIESLAQLGKTLGVLLQVFDDVGNFSSTSMTPKGEGSKKYEDLYLRRPSWIWSYAASALGHEEYSQFIHVVTQLPEEGPLLSWLDKSLFVTQLKKEANQKLSNWITQIQNVFGSENPKSVMKFEQLAHELSRSYS
jgi:geranylgeranyl pyrophosphate synthase